ncbi:MAG: hypothetical protein PHP98_03120 [Kiritimatiellae bacterium]|nr:hypothetical protein [Kiritimatiellia bacterium]
MITFIGAFFWLLAIAAVFRLLQISRRAARFQWPEILILLFLAGLLLFRPHEDIFGGEDPGSYVNSGLTYNRQRQFFYVDELLSKVPPEVRSVFYYGHAGYGKTKDACLWVRDASTATIGPHFQPAYPLMIAFVSRCGPDSWALFVAPLFAVFTALALRTLALQTLPCRWAGLVVFMAYICNPLTVWHGRCARPEIIAAFMFFAGCALTLQAWQGRRWKNAADILLGALCIGAAPFFHITAWALVIPAALAAAIAVVFKGRDDFLPWLAIIILALAAFYAQAKYVTDYYKVKRFLDIVFLRPELIAGGFGLLAAAAIAVKQLRRKSARPEISPPETVSLFLSAALFAGLAAFLASLVFFRQIYGDLPVLGRPVKNYLYLTDFRVVANMLSMPVMLLIPAGLAAWLTGRADKRPYRIILALVLFPAVMLTGNIHDFMMTRYLMVAFIPASALLLAALLTLPLPPRNGLWAAILLTAILCVLALNKRTHLVTTVEHRGFCRFLRPYAEAVKARQGILLCEYSRIAAPLEHFFGIPALGLDNERRDNYEMAEQAWAEIVRSMPDRPAFFATPWGENAPLSPYFLFEPVYQAAFHDCRLEQARRSLPVKVGKSELNLRLFKMHLKTAPPPAGISSSNAVIISFDPGNMGLRHFANVRHEPFQGQSVAPQAVISAGLDLPKKVRENAAALMDWPSQPAIKARWARARAQVLLPAPRAAAALLLIHLKAPDPDNSGYISLQLAWDDKKLGPPRKVSSGEWQWQAWRLPPLPADFPGDAAWLTLETHPAWNPGKHNFPPDLGVLISRIVSLPVQ